MCRRSHKALGKENQGAEIIRLHYTCILLCTVGCALTVIIKQRHKKHLIITYTQEQTIKQIWLKIKIKQTWLKCWNNIIMWGIYIEKTLNVSIGVMEMSHTHIPYHIDWFPGDLLNPNPYVNVQPNLNLNMTTSLTHTQGKYWRASRTYMELSVWIMMTLLLLIISLPLSSPLLSSPLLSSPLLSSPLLSSPLLLLSSPLPFLSSSSPHPHFLQGPIHSFTSSRLATLNELGMWGKYVKNSHWPNLAAVSLLCMERLYPNKAWLFNSTWGEETHRQAEGAAERPCLFKDEVSFFYLPPSPSYSSFILPPPSLGAWFSRL